MIEWNFFRIASTVVFGVTTFLFALYTFYIKNKFSIEFHGIMKKVFYTQSILPSEEPIVMRWLVIAFLYSIVPVIWISLLTCKTDYSFLILLFPIIWYYYYLRFIFWEKSDIEQEK